MPSDKAKKAYYQRNRPQILAKLKADREARKNDPVAKEEWHLYQRNRMLLQRYGISQEEYEAKLSAQKFKCAVCETNITDKRKRYFDVDHDHITGQIRGLLCGKCNKQLAVLENMDWCDRAREYLKQFQK